MGFLTKGFKVQMGYPDKGQKWMSYQELVKDLNWIKINPEFRRRLLGMIVFGALSGNNIGIGSAFRSTANAKMYFLQRYSLCGPVPKSAWDAANKKLNGTYRKWNGKNYKLKPNCAPIAAPGNSYHEPVNPEGECFAVDLTGDTNFAIYISSAFGLVTLANLAGEKWHCQPIEFPRSRSEIDVNTDLPLKYFNYDNILDLNKLK